ncbi:hypothetical protein F5X97DRAFT_171073 [Nemania serpens]|nr:hypothetical protein F5X97DRAFT_171073 [Nemania serpens]
MILCWAVLRSSVVQCCVDCDDSKKGLTYLPVYITVGSRQSPSRGVEIRAPNQKALTNTFLLSSLNRPTSPEWRCSPNTSKNYLIR